MSRITAYKVVAGKKLEYTFSDVDLKFMDATTKAQFEFVGIATKEPPVFVTEAMQRVVEQTLPPDTNKPVKGRKKKNDAEL